MEPQYAIALVYLGDGSEKRFSFHLLPSFAQLFAQNDGANFRQSQYRIVTVPTKKSSSERKSIRPQMFACIVNGDFYSKLITAHKKHGQLGIFRERYIGTSCEEIDCRVSPEKITAQFNLYPEKYRCE